MRDWFPNLDGKADPQITEAIRRLRDDQLTMRDVLKQTSKTASAAAQQSDPLAIQKTLSTLSGYDLYAGNSQSVRARQGSLVPATSGTFNWAYTTTSITWSWSGLLWYPADLWNTPERYVVVPDGQQDNTGLLPSTTYYFYPYFDIPSNSIRFALDSSLKVGVGYAHSAKSVLAAQEQNGDNHIPMSSGAMSKMTPASGTASGSGDGGSSCIRVGALVEKRGYDSPVRIETCRKGDMVRGWCGWTEFIEFQICHRDDFIRLEYRHDSIDVTPTHLCPSLDVRESKYAHLLTMDDVGWGRDGDTQFPAKLDAIRRVSEEDDYVAFTLPTPSLVWAGIRGADILNHNSLPAK